ncbi:MAG: 4-alpha-glucanotransferase [Akkermansia sp.]|nr:4-alpha-glucanotransferase [Akkermansia sp.]
MKLVFRIDYRTEWGEEVGILFDHAIVPFMLGTVDGYHWEGSIEVKTLPATYRYGVFRDGQVVRLEGGRLPHALPKWRQREAQYHISDVWRDQPLASYLFTSAFSGDQPATAKGHTQSPHNSLTLRVLCPCLRHKGQHLALLGEGKALGNWEVTAALPFEEIHPHLWSLTLDLKNLTEVGDYKLVAVNSDTGVVEEWEGGPNRHFYLPQLETDDHCVLPETELYFPSTARKVAGTAIPVFSLRSEGSQGVGDFGDLRRMVDWAVLTGQRAVQILPINDTTITGTWTDSYPYNSISIYAFHPMYIDLRQVPELANAELMDSYRRQWAALNLLPQVDYEAVNQLKRAYLRQAYEENAEAVLASAAFKTFFKENAHWLQPYAVFSCLRDRFGSPVFSQWPEHRIYDADAVAALCRPKADTYHDVAFYYYLQYLLHVQLLAAGEYARSKEVIFKGDIPIGISPNSVEAWTEPYYFNMNGQAGAPPDAFSAKGQNWGFPTYNWDVMAADGYQWWRRRFTKMAEYFTAYRIDHILGFFRIWEIPSHSVNGLLGQFSPALPMSPEEIGSFGLPFQKDFMTRPFINAAIVDRFFGEQAAEVKIHFLQHEHDDIYALRPEFDTQRKLETYFREQGRTSEADRCLLDGLYALIENVLFVPDRKNPHLYHPRISVQDSPIFERLSWPEKEAFNRLYNHYFYERHNQFWYDEAMKKLPQLTQATPMLVCGEDLGMVPDCVPWAMDQLQILSLEIQRMPKNPQHDFGHVWEYPYRSVCTISTHDMSTLRGWWEENPEETARFYRHVLGHTGLVPTVASAHLCEQIVRQHLESPALLTILTLQDWLSIDERLRYADVDAERINVPANPRHYWRYRMHLTLEQLMAEGGFNEKVTQMIRLTGRGI